MTRWLLVGVMFAACGGAYDVRTVAYDERHGARGLLDLLIPEGTGAPRPGLLLLHPGGWTAGDKGLLDTMARRLAGAGYVVANANYRLAPAVHFPRPLEDAWCALAFLRQEGVALGLDASRVGVLGFSAGANLAELMGVTAPGDFQAADCPAGITGAPSAVVAGAAPADLLRLPALGDATVAAYVGATKSEAPERYTQASPLSYLRGDAPPFFLVHGTHDLYVPWEHSQDMRDGLVERGGRARLLLVSGGGHSLNPGADLGALELDNSLSGPEAWVATLDFLREVLGAPPP